MGAVLDEIGSAARAVAERSGPAVVGIRGGRGRGSGVVTAAGQVLTNAHNLGSAEVSVVFGDGRVAPGRALGVDLDGDLAVVEVDTGDAGPVEWAGVDARMGDPVFALANPAGLGLRVSFGLVSSVARAFRGPRGRRITGGLEHTAPLPRGSSGGPVVDGAGRLVAINTHRLGDGVYVAVPAGASLRRRVDALARGESSRRRTLGIGLAPAGAARQLRRAVGLPDRDGLLVRAVEDGGVAAGAGLRVGDLIVAAGGRALTVVDDLHDAVDSADGPLTLAVVRGVEELEVTVTFTEAGDEGA